MKTWCSGIWISPQHNTNWSLTLLVRPLTCFNGGLRCEQHAVLHLFCPYYRIRSVRYLLDDATDLIFGYRSRYLSCCTWSYYLPNNNCCNGRARDDPTKPYYHLNTQEETKQILEDCARDALLPVHDANGPIPIGHLMHLGNLADNSQDPSAYGHEVVHRQHAKWPVYACITREPRCLTGFRNVGIIHVPERDNSGFRNVCTCSARGLSRMAMMYWLDVSAGSVLVCLKRDAGGGGPGIATRDAIEVRWDKARSTPRASILTMSEP